MGLSFGRGGSTLQFSKVFSFVFLSRILISLRFLLNTDMLLTPVILTCRNLCLLIRMYIEDINLHRAFLRSGFRLISHREKVKPVYGMVL